MTTRITEGYLARHHSGVKGGRDAALLDIAQDHALSLLHTAGLFSEGLVFKGGTALRKFRAGNAGRFSTDLDFAAADDGLAARVLDVIDGASLDDITFAVTDVGSDLRRGDLAITTPLGTPRLGAKIELARHPLSLAPDVIQPKNLPIHQRYSFTLPPTPIIAREEAIAEKLARYRRASLARDLYDLYWYAESGAFNEPLTRRLWVMKTYRDVTVDGRGDKPITPSDVLRPRRKAAFVSENIGLLTTPVRIDHWLKVVESRYAFLAELDEDEKRWCECNRRDKHAVTTELNAIGHATDSNPSQSSE